MNDIQPATQAPTTTISYPTLLDDLISSEGSILFSTFGGIYAIAFQGPPDFIRRGFNFCYNRGVIAPRAAIRKMYDRGVPLFYAVVSSKERLIAGLTSQFRSEMVMRGEVEVETILHESENEDQPASVEVRIDEKSVDALARNRAEAFYYEHVTHDNFMFRQEREDQFVPTYEMRIPRRTAQ